MSDRVFSAFQGVEDTASDTYGRVFAYDKSYDRITTKTERPLQLVDRIKYNTTTSDDPVIQQVCYLVSAPSQRIILHTAGLQKRCKYLHNRCYPVSPHVCTPISLPLGHCYPP